MKQEEFKKMAQQQDRHWWFVSRRQRIEMEIKRLNISHSLNILEIGAGMGANARLLKKFGRYTGVEPSEFAFGFLKEEFQTEDLRFLNASSDQVCSVLGDERFDLICLLDVLEHLDNPIQCLTDSRKLLRPNGRILISVPAHPWLWSVHDEMLEHRKRYTKSLLLNEIDASQLELKKISRFNSVLLPAVALARLFAGSESKSPGTSMPSPLVNRMLIATLGFENNVNTRVLLPMGLSIFAIACEKTSPR